jgi:hypothetical protein
MGAMLEGAAGRAPTGWDEMDVLAANGSNLANPQAEPTEKADQARVAGGARLPKQGGQLLGRRLRRSQLGEVAWAGVDPQPGP